MFILCRIVPISVMFLISAKILEVEDFSGVIKRLGIYILTVFSGLIIQGFVLLPLLYLLCTRQSPYKIISKLGPAFATAFGTSSRYSMKNMEFKLDYKVSKHYTLVQLPFL